jgi:hypothetical protein
MTIEAITYPGGAGVPVQYLRTKRAGVWDAWRQQPGSAADLDAAYVNVSGDTMTGALHVTDPTASASPNTGALTVAGGVGVAGAIYSTAFNLAGVPVNVQGIAKAGALIDTAAGHGFFFGIASVTDGGIGFCGVAFAAAWASPCPVVSTVVPSTNMASSMGTLSSASLTLHSITATTGALTDPVAYGFHLLGA